MSGQLAGQTQFFEEKEEKGPPWDFFFGGFCLGWGSPGNGLELIFTFVSSF